MTLEQMEFEQSRKFVTRHVEVMDIEKDELVWILETLGGLPLALDIVNRIAQNEGFSQLLVELREHIIPALQIDEPVRKEESARWAFDLSYRRLSLGAKTAFRSLSITFKVFLSSILCMSLAIFSIRLTNT